DDGAEKIVAPGQFFVIAPAESLAAGVARVPDDLMQPAGIANRKGPQDVGVDDGEGDGEQPQTDGERHDRGGHERRAMAHPAPGIAEVLAELIEPDPATGFVE